MSRPAGNGRQGAAGKGGAKAAAGKGNAKAAARKKAPAERKQAPAGGQQFTRQNKESRPQRPAQKQERLQQAAQPPAQPPEGVVCGRNAVLELLKSGQAVNRVLLAEGNAPAFSAAVFKLCQERGVPCRKLPKQQLTRLAGPEHHGIAACAAAMEYASLESLLAAAEAAGEPPFLVMLDGVEDPQNLGAVIRSALVAGCHGLIIPRHRAAALNATVLRASAGAAAHLPVARVANLNQALAMLQEAGCWAVAADMDGEPMWQTDLRGPLVLVLGSEGAGVSPLLKRNCDRVAAIPMRSGLGSLNVSAAAAVLLYEALRQRMADGG